MAKVYMDSFTDQITDLDEANRRLITEAQDFEWVNTITSFPWSELKTDLEKTDFWSKLDARFREIHFPLRFTEYEVYGDEKNEDENGVGTETT